MSAYFCVKKNAFLLSVKFTLLLFKEEINELENQFKIFATTPMNFDYQVEV